MWSQTNAQKAMRHPHRPGEKKTELPLLLLALPVAVL
jgi:hypothetical protein